jgi:hypothetical protein
MKKKITALVITGSLLVGGAAGAAGTTAYLQDVKSNVKALHAKDIELFYDELDQESDQELLEAAEMQIVNETTAYLNKRKEEIAKEQGDKDKYDAEVKQIIKEINQFIDQKLK